MPALVCAGWLAGRGPIEAAVGRARDRRRLSHLPRRRGRRPRRRRRDDRRRLVRVAAAALPGRVRRRDRRDVGRQLGRRRSPTPRAPPRAIRSRPSRCGSCRRSTRPAAIRPPRRQELVKAAKSSPRTPRPTSSSASSTSPSNQAIVAVLEFQTAQLLDRSSSAVAQQLAAAESACLPVRAQRTARASSIRLSSGGPSTARTRTSPNPNSLEQRSAATAACTGADGRRAARRTARLRPSATRRRPCDGVVTSSRPSGASTRRTSDSHWPCRPRARSPRSPTRGRTSRPRTAAGRRTGRGGTRAPGAGRAPAERGLGHVDADRRRAACASAAVNSPVPQPRSSARSPARTSPRRNAQSALERRRIELGR